VSCAVCGSSAVTETQHPVSPFIQNITCPRCGRYSLVAPLGAGAFKDGPWAESTYLLSAVLREYSDNGTPATVTADNLKDLLSQIVAPRNPLEAIDRFLLFLANTKTKGFFDSHAMNYDNDRAILAVNHIQDAHYIVALAERMKFIERTETGIRLDIKGWTRVDELRRTIHASDQAFVAMWFDKQMDAAWTVAIEPVFKELGLKPMRIDFVEHSDRTDEKIMTEIKRSRIVLADFTGNRGGVYFEAGFALGGGIPVIWTCKKDYFEANGLHFDTRQYNHILWTDESDLGIRLKARIEAILLLL
jgi:nucleoside 2-deoxyribosyltransferase